MASQTSPISKGLSAISHAGIGPQVEGISGAQSPPGVAVQRAIALPRMAWQSFGLLALLALTGFLNIWQITQNGYGNTYYAAAVRSMTQSRHNFFYNAFDPGGFITVDKPPVALWIQAVFAKVLGFSGFSIHLPQALVGIGTVLVVYLAVSRVFGRTAGLIGGLVAAVTPIAVAINRTNNLDASMIFFVALCAYAIVRALEKGSLRWLLASAVFMGIAFNTKFLAAYVALPALWFAYLVTAPMSFRKRVLDLAFATAVLAIVSGAWVAAFDLTPAANRPYAGGSTDNTMLNLLIDYNGLGRIEGGEAGPATGTPGPFRLFQGSLAGQVSWLAPLALIGGLAALLASGRRLQGNQRLGSIILWGGWLLTAGVVFSFAKGIFHDYYLSYLAPALGAMAGIGIVSFRRSFAGRSWLALLAPAALVATGALEVLILRYTPSYMPWLVPAVAAPAGLASMVLLVLAVLRRPAARTTVLALAIAVGALLLPPFVWSTTVLGSTGNGTLPIAGPRIAMGGFGGMRDGSQTPPDAAQSAAPMDGGPANFAGGPPMDGGPGQASVNQGLIDYLKANRGHADFLVAVQSSMSASPIIIATGEPVMAIGGFSGGDPALTVEQLAQMVEEGTLRFFLVQGGGPGGDGVFVPPSGAGVPDGVPDDGPQGDDGGGPGGRGQNNAVIQAVTSSGRLVDASEYGGQSTGGQLYDLQGTGAALLSAAR